jgi:hypothetical protein
MITIAASVARGLRRMATAWRDRSAGSRGAATSGPVEGVDRPPRPDGARLMIYRELLAAEAKHARNLRQCKKASLIEAELRAVTHAILAGEVS